MFPYPSGVGLHVGHWRGYVLSDYFTRLNQLQGKTVLHPMGFDAFGLPAENAAIADKTHPQDYNAKTIPVFIKQLQQIGAAFDWTKTIDTSQPEYYKWTQWLFLQLYKHGYAEKRLAWANWCPKDKTVLANEQVVGGKCERCGSIVTKKQLSQWYLRITDFAQELLDGLDTIDWFENVKTLQRNWIGRSEGATVIFKSDKISIPVFTTRVDTLFGVNAIVLAPEHPDVEALAQPEHQNAVLSYLEKTRERSELDRQATLTHTGVFTGSSALHPLTQKLVPIWVADYVLPGYGTGAVMSVPAHDQRDYDFSKSNHLSIMPVISKIDVPAKSFLMGAEAISDEDLEKINIEIIEKLASGSRKILIPKTSIADYERLISAKLTPGYWNEYISDKIVFIFKSKVGKVQRLELNEQNQKEIYKLAKEYSGDSSETPVWEEWFGEEGADGFYIDYISHSDKGVLINSGIYDGLKSEVASEKIINNLEGRGLGQKTINFRLRDWLVSRQRYWGAPIPIVYDQEGNPHPVDDDQLPVLLPTDVEFTPGGDSPIKESKAFQQRVIDKYGQGWTPETDTLDTFVDSSWYFLRFLSPNDDSQAFDPELVAKWLPVDLYIGGIEHAILHLLYARFIYRFLVRHKYIKTDNPEPFQKVFNIGMIELHGAKMSKSKGNVISPDPLVEHYGTDALRGYELFLGPMENSLEWNPRGINGIHRFLIKIWQLADNVADLNDSKQEQLFDLYLGKIKPMIDNFRLNTAISEAMVLVNSLAKNKKVNRAVWERFLLTIAPVFPFITEELWQKVGNQQSIFTASWPESFGQAAKSNQLIVLIDQKYAGELVAGPKLSEKEVIKMVHQMPQLAQKLADREIIKSIYKPGQLLNIITRPVAK